MLIFFLLTVVGGFLKFLVSYLKDEVEILDVIALIYSVGFLVAAVAYYFYSGENIFEIL
jgi:hypothetical protein